jgi:hypothetical protein
MTHTRILLLAAAVACLASPALARPYTPWNPWLQPWACSAFETAHRCSAIYHPRSARCGCFWLDNMGWRLNEYYGPHPRNAPPSGEVTQ